MKRWIAFLMIITLTASPAQAGPASRAVRETAEWIMKKFGKGVAGKTVDEIAEATARTVARHGDDALPLLRAAGHAGFRALDDAAEKAPEVIRLFARKGDEAVWLISEPKKLALFLKHGDDAAEALLKHGGLADELIARFGDDAAGTLTNLSRPAAQRLAMAANEGLLNATPRSRELLPIIRRCGDEAMDFIWKNKGALATAAGLYLFLSDPQAFISGAKTLVADPLIAPIAQGTDWTWIVAGAVLFAGLPLAAKQLAKARRTWRGAAN